MTRSFIETPTFTSNWNELGLTDEDLRTLQNDLLENPKMGDAIPGTGGIRKFVFQWRIKERENVVAQE